MTSEWKTLPEWVMIRIPSKDKLGHPIPPERRAEWVCRWEQFLLNPEGMRGQGCEALSMAGKWRTPGKGIFDPEAGVFLQVIKEDVEGLMMYCSREQLDFFEGAGRELLVRMGLDLHQDTVAYSDSKGLHTKSLSSEWMDKDEHENSSKTGADSQPED